MRALFRLLPDETRLVVLVVASIALSLTVAGRGHARSPDGAGAGEMDGQLREAKALFQEGNSVRRAGDLPGALAFYLRSRALVPSLPNTFNAAYCLLQLGRVDEALELYEEVLTKFRSEVNPSQQQEISDSVSTLRRKLGSVDIAGDVGSLLLIDGKVRGTLPVVAPIHVLPGRHTVRVLKEGWEPFEATAAVEAGATVAIDVKLRPLAAAGRLRVESDNLKGAELVLDGAPLGTLPWEGTLAPGPHLIFARMGELGSSLRLAHVVQGQTVTERVHGIPIGPEVRVLVEPTTAEMWIDGVPVGKGQWRGTLPLGTHPIEARELGYVTAREQRQISRGAIADIQLTLRIDPAHPRWAAAHHATGVVRLELFGGAALGGTLGSDASGSCSSTPCARDTVATGGIGGVRASYTFPSGVLIEWLTGYLRVAQGVGRTLNDSFSDEGTTVHASASLDDELRLSGGFFAAGIGYALPLAKHLELRGALDLGAFVPSARDYVSGTAAGGGRTLALNIGASGFPVYQAAPLVMPEVRLAGTFGAFEVGLGVALAIFPLQGPDFPTGELRVYGASCAQHPLAVDCAPGTTVGNDRAYGPFGLLVPTVFVGERF